MKTRPVVYALLSALLFGISTPAAKVLLDLSNPAILAGLLYCGAGLGAAVFRRVARSSGGAGAEHTSSQIPASLTAKLDRDSSERRLSAMRASSSTTRSRTLTTCFLAPRHAGSQMQQAKFMRVLRLPGRLHGA
jgi:hypothetical protein